jgi:hypothetical protein
VLADESNLSVDLPNAGTEKRGCWGKSERPNAVKYLLSKARESERDGITRNGNDGTRGWT